MLTPTRIFCDIEFILLQIPWTIVGSFSGHGVYVIRKNVHFWFLQ